MCHIAARFRMTIRRGMACLTAAHSSSSGIPAATSLAVASY
jgi:hypothetical protein